jgi:hypothetical protein
MDEHLALLLDLARQDDEERIGEDDLYVWWGKVRSPNRQQPLAHGAEVREVAAAGASAPDDETQLYLTDYRSLYVADVVGLHDGEFPVSEQPHVPAYYRQQKLNCDFWFRLGDIRRLVAEDTLAVIEELKLLRNVHYNDRPVSIYGGMVDLPLVVTRPDGRRYFDERERDEVAAGRLWAEWDAEQGSGLGGVERELRENLLGDAVCRALEPAVRTFLAAAERDFRAHRSDAAFDFAPVVLHLAKALEVQCNALLRRTLLRAPAKSRLAKVQDQTVDLTAYRSLTLRQLAHVLATEREVASALGAVLTDARWLTGQLPSILDAFAEVRNPAAHASRVDRALATRWRDRLLGVGCQGVFAELAQLRRR